MRRLVAVVVMAVIAVSLAACSHPKTVGTSVTGTSAGGGKTTTPDPETGGLIPTKEWRARQADYLAFATARPIDGGSPLSLLAHAAQDTLAGRRPDLSAATVTSLKPIFDKLEAYTDTGDFDINELLTLWLRNHRDLRPEVSNAIRDRILAFKYWWTEPTPKGMTDNQYYWTENHQIIYLADEYVAGQTFPGRRFTNSGMTGRQHVDHAEDRLMKWFEWRSRFGFSEWLSNVYWSEDMKGLLLLAEFAHDPKIARLASMTLDMLFVELAGHVEQGTFGATHGRSYQKDKLSGPDEDTFSTAKLVFDQTPSPYPNVDNATLLAVDHHYRPPAVVQAIAADTKASVIRQRAGIPLDPRAPISTSAQAPYGLPFTGEDGLMLWWGMAAQFPWQLVPLSAATVNKYNLFETSNFKPYAALKPLLEHDTIPQLQDIARGNSGQFNAGLLSQVDTYTYRTPGVMLSTAQDWRPGDSSAMDHVSQATLDAHALVFTQHPTGPNSTLENYRDDGASYWTGNGANPRAAQWKNVSISVYAPQWGASKDDTSGNYDGFTHAYFPTEKFDQVVQKAGWTIGRKGNGFVALWSERPTHWATHDPKVDFTDGLTKPFDLVASGGPDDVWVTEVADASSYASAGKTPQARFDAFVAAITKAKISAHPSSCTPAAKTKDSPPVTCPTVDPARASTVSYDSPSQGLMTFGWAPKTSSPDVPLVVDGTTIDLHPTNFRWDSPWASASWDSRIYHAGIGRETLDLDFTTATRRTTR